MVHGLHKAVRMDAWVPIPIQVQQLLIVTLVSQTLIAVVVQRSSKSVFMAPLDIAGQTARLVLTDVTVKVSVSVPAVVFWVSTIATQTAMTTSAIFA